MKKQRKSLNERFWPKVRKTVTCWLWFGSKASTGYGTFGGKYTNYKTTHRYSWEIHYGKIPKGMCVCHKCDVRLCVRPSHLFLGTPADNMLDARKKGRNWHKLTKEQVKKIRFLSKKYTHRSIARNFSISHTMVNDIVKKVWWK